MLFNIFSLKVVHFFSGDEADENESGSESWETESEHSIAEEGKVTKTEEDEKKGRSKNQPSLSKISQTCNLQWRCGCSQFNEIPSTFILERSALFCRV